MSHPYATDEQYERWYMAECCRCGQRRHKAGTWPDGYVCRTCIDRAVRIRGTCPNCGQERVLPGRRPGDGASICTTCAGITQSFICSRCGAEGKLHGGRLCTRCTFSDRLSGLLDNGTGRIRPELAPLAKHLLAMDDPRAGLAWVEMRENRPGSAADLLRRLGRGQIELTHEAFHTLQPWRAVAHLRELLMACGVLPAVDKQICSFERWLVGHLAGIDDPDHVQLIRRFTTWNVLPRLRDGAVRRPITPAARRHAGEQVKHATAFLQWLSARGLTLGSRGQAEIDVWHAEHKEHARSGIRPFLQWCAAVRLTPRFRPPTAVTRQAAPLSEPERLALLGRVLTSHDLPLHGRVAAALVLLYAQPVSRIVRLTIDDVLQDGDQVLLQLGQPPSPVPAPVADLLLNWIPSRENMNTATNRGSRWLFPGRRTGQPLRPEHLAAQLTRLGIPTAPSRGAAIRQHLLDTPAPIVAEALGYSPGTTARLAAQAGGVWNRYAPGDHSQLPSNQSAQGTRDS